MLCLSHMRIAMQLPDCRGFAVPQEEEERCREQLAVQGKEAYSHAEGGEVDVPGEGANSEFEDRRWRCIRLEPHGSDWYQRCRKMAQQLEGAAARTGIVLLLQGIG